MKQNSSILFHSMGKSLIFRYLRHFGVAAIVIATLGLVPIYGVAGASDSPPYQAYFDPAQGFKPAQPNFAKIFLQMAGSLEYYGSPEPYLRHVIAEHTRIDALYFKATGKSGSSRPDYFTDEYLENLVAGWNKLTPVLKLDSLCRLAGRNMRHAIMGSWNMTVPESLEQETNLTPSEKSTYQSLLEKSYFTKADFPTLEAFYQHTLEKLSENGKSQIRTRTWRGQQSPEKRAAEIEKSKGGTMLVTIFNEHQDKMEAYFKNAGAQNINSDELTTALITKLRLGQPTGDLSALPAFEKDALENAHQIEDALEKRLAHVNKTAKSPEQADNIHQAIISMLQNLVVMAHSEYLAAIREQIAK